MIARRMPSRLALSLALLVGATSHADTIDLYVQAAMEKRKIPGAAVAVIHKGKVIKARGYGMADVEWDIPVELTTQFLLDSVTETFTAVGVMMLVEQDKVRLDDPVRKYLRKAPKAWEAVTLRQLLGHTSGINDDGWEQFRDAYLTEYTDADIDAYAFKQKLSFKPGDRYQHCSLGYLLLGRVIEKVTGESYPEWMTANVLRPSGMTAARFWDPGEVVPHQASFYTLTGNTLVRNRGTLIPRRGTALGSYGLVASLDDLLRFDAALRGGKLIQQVTLDRMWTPVVLNAGGQSDAGLGFTVRDQRGHRRVYQAGSVGSLYAVYPEDDLAILWLSNLENASGPAWGLSDFQVPELRPVGQLPVVPDPEPERTERLMQAQRDIAAGVKKSPLLAPQLLASLTDADRKATAQALKTMTPLEFLVCDDVRNLGVRRHLAPVADQCSYRTRVSGKTVEITFDLTADGKLLDLQAEPE